MKDKSSKVAPPNFDKTWRKMRMNSSLHEEHLEMNGCLGKKEKMIFIGKSLVLLGDTNRD
jgi:hypothetical protein